MNNLTLIIFILIMSLRHSFHLCSFIKSQTDALICDSIAKELSELSNFPFFY
jgi:hypothetical protein